MSIKEDAEDLGITVGYQWSDDMIQAAIDEKLNEDADGPVEGQGKNKKGAPKKELAKKTRKAIINISGGRVKVYGVIVQPGGSYEPTEMDMEDVKGGKRIDNAIEKGYLQRG